MTDHGASSTTNRKVPRSKLGRVPDHDVFKQSRPRTRIKRYVQNVELSPSNIAGGFDGIETINLVRSAQGTPRRSATHDGTWSIAEGKAIWRPQNPFEHSTGIDLARLSERELPVLPSSNYAQRIQTNTRSLLARHTNIIPNESFFITINLGVLFADQIDCRKNYRSVMQRMFQDFDDVFKDEEPDFIHLNGYIEVARHFFAKQSNHRSLFVKDHLIERVPDDGEEVFVIHAHILCTAFDERGAWPHERWSRLLRYYFTNKKQIDVRAIGLRKIDGQDVAEQSQNCIEYQAKRYDGRHDSDMLKAANYFMRCALPNMGSFEGTFINQRPRIIHRGGQFLHRRDNYLNNTLPPWFKGFDDDFSNFLCTRKMACYRQNNDPLATKTSAQRFHRIHRVLRRDLVGTKHAPKVRLMANAKPSVNTHEVYYDFAEPLRSERGETNYSISILTLMIIISLMIVTLVPDHFP